MKIAAASVDALVHAIAADRPSPGAGAAGGVALALAAACCAKALRITARHAEDPALAAQAHTAEEIAAQALASAQRDSDDFPALLKPQADAADEQILAADGQAALALCDQLRLLLAAAAPHVTPELQGDLNAALHLLDAAEAIHRRNLAELARA